MLRHPIPRISAVILAGGLSTRMGRDKSRLRLGRLTLVGILRRTCVKARLRVRVIRTDAIPRCGPLGGILTALRRSRSDALLFLSCDMPFVSVALLNKLIQRARKSGRPTFLADSSGVGFPFLLWRGQLVQVEAQIQQCRFSLQELARAVRAVRSTPTRSEQHQRFNLNTPEDWEKAKICWHGPDNLVWSRDTFRLK